MMTMVLNWPSTTCGRAKVALQQTRKGLESLLTQLLLPTVDDNIMFQYFCYIVLQMVKSSSEDCQYADNGNILKVDGFSFDKEIFTIQALFLQRTVCFSITTKQKHRCIAIPDKPGGI
jgi:hypothetical protein